MRPFAGALAVALVLAACQSGPGPATPSEGATARPTPTGEAEVADGGTLRYAISQPSAIVPVEADNSAALTVVDAVFDSLTFWAPAGGDAPPSQLEVRPAAAVSWSSDSDARTWTFELRPGATFHDQTPVTAADFKFAWEVAVDIDEVGYHLSEVAGYDALREGEADELAGVTALDEGTLQVRLEGPNADFPAVVGHPALGPLPRELWQSDADAFREQPVGNGPFAMSEAWAHQQFVRVAPFEHWRNRVAKPSVTEVIFQVLDAETAYLAFQQGRIDFTDVPSGALEDAAERYEESPDGYTGPGILRGDVPALYYLGFNVTTPPFDDPEVRRAVSQAVDRAAIVSRVLDGMVRPARSIVPPALPGAFGGGLCRMCRHDPDAAEEVFAERGITELTLWYNREGGHERIARVLRRSMQQVGVRLELRAADFPEYLATLEAGEAGLFRFGWTADYPTADSALYPILHSSASGEGEAAHNYGDYSNPDVDALLDWARVTLDDDERDALYREAADVALNRDHVLAPLFTYRHAAVASERVEGLVYNAMGLVDLVSVRIVQTASD